MTDKEILTQAIKKAEKNGFAIEIYIKDEKFGNGRVFGLSTENSKIEFMVDEGISLKKLVWFQVDNMTSTICGLNDLIFSHDFAKAFFGIGDDLWTKDDPRHNDSKLFKNFRRYFYYNEATEEEGEWVLPKWKQCLQQMVVSENPLQYLKTYMEEFNV